MEIDILSVEGNKDVLHEIKSLNRIESFKNYKGTLGGGMDRNKVIKYIVLLYSKDSILNEKVAVPLEDRQLKAADLAGFDRDKNNNFKDKRVQEWLFELKNDEIFEMVFEFLIFLDDALWREIVTLEHELKEYHMLRMKPLEGKYDKDLMTATEKKGKFRKECNEIRDSLKKCYDEFYREFDDVKAKAKEKRKPTTLESWAKDNTY